MIVIGSMIELNDSWEGVLMIGFHLKRSRVHLDPGMPNG